jgi:uncharacterized SAM-binding protein YcdF (DUF218 family)
MSPGELKPLAAALVLPPAGPLLLALIGLLLARRFRTFGWSVTAVALLLGWALSTNAVALLLAPHLLPPVAAAQPQELRDVQAIVVLGGGVLPTAPEYGTAQPSSHTAARLRYGVWLARRSGKPLAFAGGVGWSAVGSGSDSEASVARRVLQQDYGLAPRWLDEQSRDTAENAEHMAALMLPDRVRRIALVTGATHMPRAAAAFRQAGFEVVPAPTGFVVALERPLMEWLPSIPGADNNRQLLREWLGRALARTR